MGIVYRAEDPFIHRTVAVKVLHTTNGLTPQQIGTARERFWREAQAAGSIDHPNIIRIFDVGEEDESGELYIVMEYVSGSSLERMINEADLGLERAAEIIGQIASGLDAAHARGIIHRDIKPSNILFTEDGTAKIADFGITRVDKSFLTQDTRALGTPAYMSPEQVNGQVLDPRSDLFSLGVLSYEILAGRKPFEGTDAVSIAYAIAHSRPVPISVANSELPQALDRVLERILAKEPSERFATGREFHEAFLPCLSHGDAARSSTLADVSRRRKHTLLGLAGVAMLAAVVFLPPFDISSLFNLAPVASKAEPIGAAATVSADNPTPKKQLPLRKTAKQAIQKSSAPPRATKSASRASVTEATSTRHPVPTANVTISLKHRLRQGTLIVSLDGVIIFDETFSISKLALFQTTTWDPVNAPAGGHKLSARVNGKNGKTYLSDSYTLEFPRGKGIELRIGFKGDMLTVKQRSG